MPFNTQMATATVNAQADVLAARCNGGIIKIYDGAQPATANTAPGTNVLGATLTFGATAFTAPVDGLLTANFISPSAAVATITPTWARFFQSDGVTVVMDVSAGFSGANMLIGPFTIGTSVGCEAFTHRVQKSATGL